MTRMVYGKKTCSQSEYLICQSSARLIQGRCVLLLKSLFSKHNLKPLLPSFCVLLLVIFGLSDRLHNFVAGIFIPQYHFAYAVALCFGQVVISLLFVNLLHLLGVVPLQRYSRPLGERLLVPSICGSIYGVLSMWAKANSSFSGLLTLVMPLLPLLTMGLSFLFKLTSQLSTHISVLISFISGTSLVITVSRGVSGLDFLDYIYAPLALLLFSISLVWLAKVSEAAHHLSPDTNASVFDIYYTHLVNQSGILGLLWLLHSDSPWYVLSRGSWRSLLFHGYLYAILLLGMVLNFLVGITALSLSPLAAAVLHSVNQIVLPFLRLI